MVEANKFRILWKNRSSHVAKDVGGGVIGQRGDADVNNNGTHLLQLCCNNTLCIMNTFFQHRDLRRYTWCRDSLGQTSLMISA